MKKCITLVALIMVVKFSAAQVFFTPPMSDTVADEAKAFIAPGDSAWVAITNTGSAPLVFRPLLNWAGHESDFESDSTYRKFLNRDPEKNLGLVLKSRLSGVNRSSFIVVGGGATPYEYSPKQLGVTALWGWPGRNCLDFTEMGIWGLTSSGIPSVRTGIVAHTFCSVVDSGGVLAPLDLDPDIPPMLYDTLFSGVLEPTGNVFFRQKEYSDSGAYAGYRNLIISTTKNYAWANYIRPTIGTQVNSWQPALPPLYKVKTDNTIILPPGGIMQISVVSNGYVFNSDLPYIRRVEDEINDTVGVLLCGPNPGTAWVAMRNILRQFAADYFPQDTAKMYPVFDKSLVRFQDHFGSSWDQGISQMRLDRIKFVFEYPDTAVAGRDFRIPFFLDKALLANGGIIGERSFYGPTQALFLNLYDSLETVVDATAFTVPDSSVQTAVSGYLNPTKDTTIIWSYYNSGMLHPLPGMKFQLISGDIPQVTVGHSQTTTSVETVQADHVPGIEVFPNPATDKIFITGGQGPAARVVNTLGQKVLDIPLVDGKGYADISGIEPGTYIVNNGKSSKKITKN